MTQRADVTVKNTFKWTGIDVERLDPAQRSELKKPVNFTEEEIVGLQSFDSSLKIMVPEHIDIKQCYLTINSILDVQVRLKVNERCWIVNLMPNDGNSEVPTTVNVDVGGTEPE